MIHTFKCDADCSSEHCRQMGGGWYSYGSNGKQGFARYETPKLGPYISQNEAEQAASRVFPEYVDKLEGKTR